MSQATSIEEALAAIISSAASPAIQEAQALLLRRLALEGDVIPSRIPAPRNITEVGGYLNQLEHEHSRMRVSALASALGLASPVDTTPWDDTTPNPGFGSVPNDLARFNDSTLVLAAPVRADFAAAWRTAVVPRLAAIDAAIALYAPPPRLPSATEPVPQSMLPVLGREMFIAPSAALSDPDNDAIVLGRSVADDAAVLQIFIRSRVGGTASAVDAVAVASDDTANVALSRVLGPKPLVPLDDLLIGTGFHSGGRALPVPASRFDTAWARLTNVAGLLPGVSRLGDELSTVWTSREIARSCFADRLDALWNGTTFVVTP